MTATRRGSRRSHPMARARSTAICGSAPARRSSSRSRPSRSRVSPRLWSRASSIAATVAPCSRATISDSPIVPSRSISTITPATSSWGLAMTTTRPCSRSGPPASIARWIIRSRAARDSRNGPSASLQPARAMTLPVRSSTTIGRPVRSWTASAMPASPVPPIAARVRRSWISDRRRIAATLSASWAFEARNSAAAASSR